MVTFQNDLRYKEGAVKVTHFRHIYLCAEILAVMVRDNSNIKGIAVTDTEFKLSQYADDTTLLFDVSERSLRHSLLTLKLSASFSGLNINVEKTRIVWIGSIKGSNRKFCEQYDLCWEKETFSVLGVKFSINLKIWLMSVIKAN